VAKKKKKENLEDGNRTEQCLIVAGKSLVNFKIRLKYAMQLRRSDYLEVLSLEE
jgi:hypothetical protein